MSTLKSARLKNLKDKHTEQEKNDQIEQAKELARKTVEVEVDIETVELKDNKKTI